MNLPLRLSVVALLATAALPVSGQTAPGTDPCRVLEIQETLAPLLSLLEPTPIEAAPEQVAEVRNRNVLASRQDVAALEAYIKEGEKFAERARTEGCAEVAGRAAERLPQYRGYLASTRERLSRLEAEAGAAAGPGTAGGTESSAQAGGAAADAVAGTVQAGGAAAGSVQAGGSAGGAGQAGGSAGGGIEGAPVRPPRAALPALRAVLRRAAEANEPSPVRRSAQAAAQALNGLRESLGAGTGSTGSGAAGSGFFDGMQAP